MTPQPSVPTSPIELALAEAAALSRARNLETHVLVGADGRYRVIEGDARVARGETLIAMVDAAGETLMYALRMVA